MIFLTGTLLHGQVVINEGSNRNYNAIADEDGDHPDWIEIYNPGSNPVNLLDYSLTDDPGDPGKWTFPAVSLLPGHFRTIFCSGKDRKPTAGFVIVKNTGPFTPATGWNTHTFTTPFYWDGISNLLINVCSYSSTGYTSNSVFKQTETSFWSTSYTFMDGSTAACSWTYGYRAKLRPDLKINGHIVGTGQIQNSPTDYPAPYGNWYWGARHQMLVLASEMTEAGLTPGNITSLAFVVVSTDPNTVYDYIEISVKAVTCSEVSGEFEPVDPTNSLHTNFKITSEGESVYLYSPTQSLVSQLFVNCDGLDNSQGSKPDGSASAFLFETATPSASNNGSDTYTGYCLPPVFSIPSGFYSSPQLISITNPNPSPSIVRYTLDGSEPTNFSPAYTGEPIPIHVSAVLKAKAYSPGILPSQDVVATYLLNVSHLTPVISIATDNSNLYGPAGIFDNWWYDWRKSAYIEYFDSTKNLIFSQRAGIQIDGGWGGARANAQHSMRVRLADGVLGDGPVDYPIIPDRPNRTTYSQFFLRNGSNQFLVFPYKDACQAKMMSAGTNNHYSSWRPVSVYLNGEYFGLYELREKIDAEYFETLEGADPGETDVLSMTAWNNFVLHAVEGSVEPFLAADSAFSLLDPSDTSYWNSADQYFDLVSYTDYIIGESWMANTDWPWNNIKIYRSDQTGYRWRFCLTDMELGLAPNGWNDYNFDHIYYMMTADPQNPYINIWQKSIQNNRYHDYFINRYADLMNTAYGIEHLSAIENDMFDRTVDEMQNEYARWGDPNNIQGQMMEFTNNHSIFENQLSHRTSRVRNHIRQNFNLPNQVQVTLDVDPPDGGTIHISTITPGEYPWEGIYFNGIPVKIEAVAADGYKFSHWDSNELMTDTLNPVFLDTLDAYTIAFTAHFEAWGVPAPVNDNPDGITIFPNPARDFLYLRCETGLPGGSRYQVIDINGRTLLDGLLPAGVKETAIRVGSLDPSVYVIRIATPGGPLTQQRFVKLRSD